MTPIDVFYPSYLLTYLERDCARIATIGATVPDMKLIC
jgi:hypothetical protein